MKFSEYLSSYITPQMTLLEKFNALLKYLEENGNGLFIHTIVMSNNKTIKFISTSNEKVDLVKLNDKSFLFNVLSLKYDNNIVLKIRHQVSYNVLYYYGTDDLIDISLIGLYITGYEVSVYEG